MSNGCNCRLLPLGELTTLPPNLFSCIWGATSRRGKEGKRERRGKGKEEKGRKRMRGAGGNHSPNKFLAMALRVIAQGRATVRLAFITLMQHYYTWVELDSWSWRDCSGQGSVVSVSRPAPLHAQNQTKVLLRLTSPDRRRSLSVRRSPWPRRRTRKWWWTSRTRGRRRTTNVRRTRCLRTVTAPSCVASTICRRHWRPRSRPRRRHRTTSQQQVRIMNNNRTSTRCRRTLTQRTVTLASELGRYWTAADQVVVVVVVYLFQQANKTCNNNIISPIKPGNQKGKCPSCWPPIEQTK